ncbi:hypothetical protein CY35_11G096400 [Sphagnum magellanicum]|nr:hypothetical protein CY35_11G096400 [Sphagnum magellanicum]
MSIFQNLRVRVSIGEGSTPDNKNQLDGRKAMLVQKLCLPLNRDNQVATDDLRPGGVKETWGRCVVYTRWTNPLLLSRKNSENSVLCLALVAIVSHGAAVSMLQVFCPFTSSSLMSNAKPKARTMSL